MVERSRWGPSWGKAPPSLCGCLSRCGLLFLFLVFVFVFLWGVQLSTQQRCVHCVRFVCGFVSVFCEQVCWPPVVRFPGQACPWRCGLAAHGPCAPAFCTRACVHSCNHTRSIWEACQAQQAAPGKARAGRHPGLSSRACRAHTWYRSLPSTLCWSGSLECNGQSSKSDHMQARTEVEEGSQGGGGRRGPTLHSNVVAHLKGETLTEYVLGAWEVLEIQCAVACSSGGGHSSCALCAACASAGCAQLCACFLSAIPYHLRACTCAWHVPRQAPLTLCRYRITC